MVAVIYSILWIIFSWKWVDWRNWEKYYPTVLFAVVGDLLYEVICSEYPLWAMEANGLPNRTLPMLLLGFIGMPLSVMIYLSNYPDRGTIKQQFMYIVLFTYIFVILEYISIQYGSITYHNGWNLFWSLVFDVAMFTILRIHSRNVKMALVLSVGFILVLSLLFDLTFDKMK